MAIGGLRSRNLGGVILRYIRIDPMNEADIEEISLGTEESYFANFRIDSQASIFILLRACDQFWEGLNLLECVMTDEYYNIIPIGTNTVQSYFGKGYPVLNDSKVAMLYLFENFNRYNVELPRFQSVLTRFNSDGAHLQDQEKVTKDRKLVTRARQVNPGLAKYIRISEHKVNHFNDTRLCRRAGILSKIPVFIFIILFFAAIFLHQVLFTSPEIYYWLPVSLGDYLSASEPDGIMISEVRNATSFVKYAEAKFTSLQSFNFPDQFNWLNLTLQQSRYSGQCPRESACSDCCQGAPSLPAFNIGGETIQYKSAEENRLSYSLSGRFNSVSGQGYKFTADSPGSLATKITQANNVGFFTEFTKNIIVSSTSHYQGSLQILYTLQNFESNSFGMMIYSDYRYIGVRTSLFEDDLQQILVLGYTSITVICALYWLIRVIINLISWIRSCKAEGHHYKGKKRATWIVNFIISFFIFTGFSVFTVIAFNDLFHLNQTPGQIANNIAAEDTYHLTENYEQHFRIVYILFMILTVFLLRYTVISSRFTIYFHIIGSLSPKIILLVVALVCFFLLFSFLARLTFNYIEYQDPLRGTVALFLNFARQDKGPWELQFQFIGPIPTAIMITAALYLIFTIVLFYLPVAYLMEQYRLETVLTEEVQKRGEMVPKKKVCRKWICDWGCKRHKKKRQVRQNIYAY